MKLKTLNVLGMLCVLLLGASTGFYQNETVEDVPEGTLVTIHDVQRTAIRINHDIDLATQAAIEGWPGDGSEDDPYVIEGYEIDGTGHGYCIYVGNTSSHFIIRDNRLHNASGRGQIYYRNSGINFHNVTNGTVRENVIMDCGFGIMLNHGCTNNTVTGNSVSYNKDYGIYLYTSTYNTLSGNTVFNNTRGIYVLHRSHHTTVTQNVIEHNAQNGILLQLADHNTISDNIIKFNQQGSIYISNSGHTHLSNNEISNNTLRGIYILNSVYIELFENTMVNNGINIFGGRLEHWNTHTISTDNTVNGRPVHYWKDVTGGTVPPGSGQIILANCTSVTVENQQISDTDIGIILGYSDGNILSNNVAFLNFHGISVSHSTGNTILNNHVSHNSRGIYIYFGDDNHLSKNIVEENDFGFHLHSSTNTTLENNSISDNDYGVYLFRSIRASLEGNEIMGHGILMGGDKVEYWNTHTIGTSNTANGGPVYYWKNQRSGTVPPDAGQVILANCSQIVVHGQNIGHDIGGIQLGFSFSNTISNNTASYNQRGIYLYNSYENTLSDNILYNNSHGIFTLDSYKNLLSENEMYNNTYGIYMSNSDNNNASANTLGNNNYGIYIYRSERITLHNNDMHNDGIMIDGNQFRHWDTHTIDTSNTVNGKPVYYWKNETGGTVPEGAGQVILANCMGVTVTGQRLIDTAAGLQMGYSVENVIFNNTVMNNHYGIYLYASSDNTIYHNNFMGNENQAREEGVNQWDDGFPSGGNYWSDYREIYPEASEIDDSGIWNTPYAIPGTGNQDTYPLMHPRVALGLTLHEPSQGILITEDSVTVRWSSTGGVESRVHEVRLDEGVWIYVGPGTTYTFHGLEDGEASIQVKVDDGIMEAVLRVVNFTVDTTPPWLEVIEPRTDKIFTEGNVTVEWEGGDETSGISHYAVRLEGENWVPTGSNTSHTFTHLEDGFYRVAVRAWDAAGHNSTQDVDFAVDTTPPLVEIITPGDGVVFRSNIVMVEWYGKDDTSGISNYSIRINGGDWICKGTSAEHLFMNLEHGEHTVCVMAYDNASHVSTDSVTFIIASVVEEEDPGESFMVILVVMATVLIFLGLVFLLRNSRKVRGIERETGWYKKERNRRRYDED